MDGREGGKQEQQGAGGRGARWQGRTKQPALLGVVLFLTQPCEAFPPVQQFCPPAPARLPCRQVFESPDDLLHRVEGLMLLYGAIVQV